MVRIILTFPAQQVYWKLPVAVAQGDTGGAIPRLIEQASALRHGRRAKAKGIVSERL